MEHGTGRPLHPAGEPDPADVNEPFDASWATQPPLVREGFPILFLVVLALLLAWNRAVYDWWLGRHDVITQEVPWNYLLGTFLRSFTLPGWDPHLFSGSPLAGDPRSGWGFFFNMIPFGLIADPLIAYKVKVAIDMVFAITTTYVLARVLGIGQLGAMLSGIVFTFGPLSFHETHCCTVRSYLALTIPAAFLGVELMLRARRWPMRIGGFAVASFAMSQWWSSFPGQGSLDATLLISGWITYRGLVSPPIGRPGFGHRLFATAVTGATVIPFGLILDLGALWPRLEVYRESTLAGGYTGVIGYDVAGYDLPGLLRRFMVDAEGSRDVTIAAGAIILMVMAPFLARARYGVPFFAGMTIVIASLTLRPSPLSYAFNLIPGWENLHDHNVPITLTTIMVGPAILAGAALDRLWVLRGRIRAAILVPIPLIVMLVCFIWFTQRNINITATPLVAAGLVTLLIYLILDDSWAREVPRLRRIYRLLPVAILVVVYMQPMGLELVDGVIGRSFFIKGWDYSLQPKPDEATAADTYVHTIGPGNTGKFLLDQQQHGQYFRYAGYEGTGLRDAGAQSARGTVVQRRYVANVQAMQQNGRSIYLGLYETQGYNPTELSRYADFMTAVNGKPQDYHFAALTPPGGNLDLLSLLNVRYVLVDASLPPARADVRAVTSGKSRVYSDKYVTIYQNTGNLGPAWIVHDIRSVDRGAAQAGLANPAFQPGSTALVEGSSPSLPPATGTSRDAVSLTSFAPDRVTYAASSNTGGFLVMSEIYEAGWHAYLDGKRVPLHPTDVALRGVSLPAGSHTVELRYEPLNLRAGFAISVAAHVALLAALIGAGYAAWSRRRPHRLRRRHDIVVP